MPIYYYTELLKLSEYHTPVRKAPTQKRLGLAKLRDVVNKRGKLGRFEVSQ